MVVVCTCRVCKTEYRSLLRSTSCCRIIKMKRDDTAAAMPVKFKTQQSKLKEFHPHEIDWRNLLSELREMGYPDRSIDAKSG